MNDMKVTAGSPVSDGEYVCYSYTVNIIERQRHASDFSQDMFDTMSMDLKIQELLQATTTTFLESRDATQHLRCNVQE